MHHLDWRRFDVPCEFRSHRPEGCSMSMKCWTWIRIGRAVERSRVFPRCRRSPSSDSASVTGFCGRAGGVWRGRRRGRADCPRRARPTSGRLETQAVPGDTTTALRHVENDCGQRRRQVNPAVPRAFRRKSPNRISVQAHRATERSGRVRRGPFSQRAAGRTMAGSVLAVERDPSEEGGRRIVLCLSPAQGHAGTVGAGSSRM